MGNRVGGDRQLTAGSSSMSLHGSSLAVKGIVGERGEVLLGTGEAALENTRPDRRGTDGGGAGSLGQAESGGAREHNV